MENSGRNYQRSADYRETLARRGTISTLVAGALLIFLSLLALSATDILTPLTVAAVVAAVLFAVAVVVAAIAFYTQWVRQNRYAGRPAAPRHEVHTGPEAPRARTHEEPPQFPEFPEQERPDTHDRP